eukprot:11698172-Prorocentrum_lima.AAC.1
MHPASGKLRGADEPVLFADLVWAPALCIWMVAATTRARTNRQRAAAAPPFLPRLRARLAQQSVEDYPQLVEHCGPQ